MSIARMLEEKGYTTKRGNTDWRTSAIKGILTNEKYKGDVIMQKTFVSDLFTKQKKVNRGDLPMYLVRDHHEPIIEPAVFDKVQVEIAKRNSLKALTDKGLTPNSRHSQYALTGLIECGECGAKYRRTTWSKRGVKKVVWRCISRLEYYISWLMSGFIPASAGTQSQKLEFGTSDGEYTPIMIGMIHQNGADNLIPFIKVNNMGIVYGSESIEPNKIYRFAAMIKMTGDKDAISLKVYPLEGTPKSKWDATISVALNPAVLDRLNFTCNNGDASYNVEYGDLKVQRYSRESMDIFEKLSAELAKAEEEYNEEMLAEVKERLNEMVDGICRSELTERISKLESKIEIEKNTRVKIEQVITALENTDITESKYNEIMEECKSVEELINLLYSVDSKNNYLSKLNEIYSKLYYVGYRTQILWAVCLPLHAHV